MELLQYQTGLKLQFKDVHIGQRDYPTPSQEERQKIEKLMPVDMYIYEYAKQLFENHWYWYLVNVKEQSHHLGPQESSTSIPPKFADVIDGCVSAPNYLKCPGEKEWIGVGPGEIK